MLAILTFRPEFRPPWPKQSHVRVLALTRLGRNQGAALVERVAGANALPHEVIFRHGTPPEATYSFKHVLVQDVAYGTLLKSRRQQLHARIAKMLEQRFSETADAQPEFLAHHLTEAALTEKAVEYWGRAGQLASGRWVGSGD